jgi:hypothetical protein
MFNLLLKNYQFLTIGRKQFVFMLKNNANDFLKPIDFQRCEE